MKIALILSGTELLRGDQRDTLIPAVTAALRALGLQLGEAVFLPDEREQLLDALSRLCEGYDLCLLSGGLGITEDDLTRELLAVLTESPLEVDKVSLQRLERRYPHLDRSLALRFAQRPERAVCLDNEAGVAPGLRCAVGRATLFAFPGVPREFEGLVAGALIPWFHTQRASTELSVKRSVEFATLSEAELQRHLDARPPHAEIDRGIQALGDGRLRLTLSAPERHLSLLTEQLEYLCDALPHALVSRAGGGLIETLTARAIAGGLRLGCAESCTGGLIAQRITQRPGVSSCFAGGVVAYENEVKRGLLQVRSETLSAFGAVSEECAAEMAAGARSALRCDWAVSTTGVAGPGGGSPEKPVGLVCFAIAGPRGEEERWRRCFHGDRRQIQAKASTEALHRLSGALERAQLQEKEEQRR